jgi:hypothetical protein
LQTESKCRTMKQEGRHSTTYLQRRKRKPSPSLPSGCESKRLALNSRRRLRLKTTPMVAVAQAEAAATPRGPGGRGGEQGGRGSRANTGRWAWKDVPPPPSGSPHTKVVDGKTYYHCCWCGNHLSWTLHTHEVSVAVVSQQEGEQEPSSAAQAIAAITSEHGNPFHDID